MLLLRNAGCYLLEPSVKLLMTELPPTELHLLPSLNCCLLLAHWSIASSWEPSLALSPLRVNSCDSFRGLLFSKFWSRWKHIKDQSETHLQDRTWNSLWNTDKNIMQILHVPLAKLERETKMQTKMYLVPKYFFLWLQANKLNY